ncbi:MAG: hypothetical protein Q8936_01605 [Bacillota bacterium]|nr:hypothetical protein [Bacillota bacterium]
MSKTIPLSFKETDEDIKLLLEIKGQGNRSCFIKDAVRFFLKYRYANITIQNNPPPEVREPVKDNKLDKSVSNAISSILGE